MADNLTDMSSHKQKLRSYPACKSGNDIISFAASYYTIASILNTEKKEFILYFIDDFQFSACPTENRLDKIKFRNDFLEYHYRNFYKKVDLADQTGNMRTHFLEPIGSKDYGY